MLPKEVSDYVPDGERHVPFFRYSKGFKTLIKHNLFHDIKLPFFP